MTQVVEFDMGSIVPEAQRALVDHAPGPNVIHSNLIVTQCVCAVLIEKRPVQSAGPDGGTCFICGNMTVRTGTCTTCTACGTTTGCG